MSETKRKFGLKHGLGIAVALAVVAGGLKQGETVILDGLQRARPGIQVAPAPAAPRPGGL